MNRNTFSEIAEYVMIFEPGTYERVFLDNLKLR
jgi:hypothetical protein